MTHDNEPATAPVSVGRCVTCGLPMASNNHVLPARCSVFPADASGCIEPERHHPFQPPPTPAGAADVSALVEALLERLYPVRYNDTSTGEPVRSGHAWKEMDRTRADLDAIIAAAEHRARASVGVDGLGEAWAAAAAVLPAGWQMGVHHRLTGDFDTADPDAPGTFAAWAEDHGEGLVMVLRDSPDAALRALAAALPPTSDPEAGA